ncbi:hypothetical protein [Pelosinus propionicus]|uniref:FlgN protein n=1 Tax=Pelosinus propionicus DSM 13327 TaxID=1123291 RepID=A0A1I4HTG6_9FIRM|nr:hypothetical protein [Pelosinus propionicus]SFL45067.1 hypothetical protein SAMN04490355_10058 [Pelosinus propionicus DSM 13327]
MQQENIEFLYIKHCNNLRRLSMEQLQAIKDEQGSRVAELAEQKQIVMDSLIALQEQIDIKDCHTEIGEKVKEILQQIAISEKESQQIIKERCASISKQMLANRKEMNIQAYEEAPSQTHGNLCNIEK